MAQDGEADGEGVIVVVVVVIGHVLSRWGGSTAPAEAFGEFPEERGLNDSRVSGSRCQTSVLRPLHPLSPFPVRSCQVWAQEGCPQPLGPPCHRGRQTRFSGLDFFGCRARGPPHWLSRPLSGLSPMLCGSRNKEWPWSASWGLEGVPRSPARRPAPVSGRPRGTRSPAQWAARRPAPSADSSAGGCGGERRKEGP